MNTAIHKVLTELNFIILKTLEPG